MNGVPWTQEESELLAKLCDDGVSRPKIAETIGRSIPSVTSRAKIMGLSFRREGEWIPEDIETLKQMVGDGKGRFEIAEAMGRSVGSIQAEATKLHIKFAESTNARDWANRYWTKVDKKKLEELWYDWHNTQIDIARALDRSIKAVMAQAKVQGLDCHFCGLGAIKMDEVSREMGVSHEQVYSWLTKGLKHIHYGPFAGVVEPDLLYFLKSHPEEYDATKISRYLFIEEPDWLIAKRRTDSAAKHSKHGKEWTDDEDRLLCELNEQRLSDVEMSERLGRSLSSIRHRKYLLCLVSGRTWRREEIELLKSSENMDELLKLLPGRSKAAIDCKKRQLALGF